MWMIRTLVTRPIASFCRSRERAASSRATSFRFASVVVMVEASRHPLVGAVLKVQELRERAEADEHRSREWRRLAADFEAM